MSKGRKREDEFRKKHPVQHCNSGKCVHPLYGKHFPTFCKLFRKLIKEGKTPQSCPWHTYE